MVWVRPEKLAWPLILPRCVQAVTAAAAVVAAVATVGAVAAVVATAEVDMAAAATRQSPDHFCIGVLPVYFMFV